MKKILKGLLIIVSGCIVGCIVNFGLVNLGHFIFPIENLDPNNMEAYAALIPTLEFKYFIFPFLAHAIGTLAGAVVAGCIAIRNKMVYAYVIGMFFLIGGIVVHNTLPGPTWFVYSDLLIAYLPMAWIGGTIAKKKALK